MEISKTECKRILRTLELKAYRSVVDALRAQGTLTSSKHEVLKNLAAALKVSDERYRSEIRRAVNDDLLNTIAQRTSGINTETEWRAESVKRVPLTPMVASQTAFTVLADTISDLVVLENRRLSSTSGVESNNVINAWKTRSERNSTKYKTSKILESLLQKRKNHHQEAILSEIEKIKLSNRYAHSNKSDYQEISHINENNSDLSVSENYSHKTVSWRSDNEIYPLEITERFDSITNRNFRHEQTQSKKCSERLEIISDPCPKNKKSKFKQKIESFSNSNHDDQLPSSLTQLHSSNSRNLRLKPMKKYSYNSVEISSFENENTTDDTNLLNSICNESVSTVKSAIKTVDPSVGSHIEISYHDKTTKNVAKGRKSKRRGKARTKRSGTIVKMRKLDTVQRVESDPVKETPARISRVSMRNARRKNYARMASGDYDISELRSMKKENKVDFDDRENEKNKTTEIEDQSDNSNAPIEVFYNNPMAPKNSSNYELDTTVTHFPEDDMRPHTFNLIPASRRLKMLKKRAKSPISEEVPAKKADIPYQNEQNAAIAKFKLNDISTLRKVLAAHENIGNMTSCDTSDLPEIVKELLDIRNRSTGDLVEIKKDLVNKKIPPVGLSNVKEKKISKPKSKISEISSIENLHSILAKVKDGEKLKKDSLNSETTQTKKDISNKDSKTNTIPKEPSGAFIEVDNLERCSSNTSFSEEEENFEDASSELNEFEIDANMEEQNIVKTLDEQDSEMKSSTNEDIVSLTVNEVEEHMESDFSEQLIDIESADVIISDNLSEKDSSIVPVQDEMKESINVSEIDRKSFSLINEPSNEQTEDVIVIDVDEDEVSNSNYSNSTDVNESVPISAAKSNISNKSDFRYVADVDDPCVQIKPKPPVFQTLPKNTIVITKSLPTSSSSLHSTPLTAIINLKPNSLIKLEPSILVNPVQNNKIKEISMNDNVANVKKPFVLLETTSTTNSKSLLKSISLQKTTNNNLTDNIDSSAKKPKKLAIYSSLKNINLAKFSSLSQNASSDTNVTNKLNADLSSVEIRTPKSNPLISFKTIKSTEPEPKKIELPQTLGKNLKLFDLTTKDKINISNSVDSEKFIEISSSNFNSKTNS